MSKCQQILYLDPTTKNCIYKSTRRFKSQDFFNDIKLKTHDKPAPVPLKAYDGQQKTVYRYLVIEKISKSILYSAFSVEVKGEGGPGTVIKTDWSKLESFGIKAGRLN